MNLATLVKSSGLGKSSMATDRQTDRIEQTEARIKQTYSPKTGRGLATIQTENS